MEKEVLSDLLTYSSFKDFSMMMNRAYENADCNPRIKQNILEVTNKSMACCLSIAATYDIASSFLNLWC